MKKRPVEPNRNKMLEVAAPQPTKPRWNCNPTDSLVRWHGSRGRPRSHLTDPEVYGVGRWLLAEVSCLA